jgi:rubrerythrin
MLWNKVAKVAEWTARTRVGGDRQATEGVPMAEPVPAGSDVSAGTYRCTNCGTTIDVGSTKHLPPCPACGNGQYASVSGGDSKDDPYPNRN